MFIETNSEYSSGIKLDVYKNTYSLLDARESDDGEVRIAWCKKQIGRDTYTTKNIPMGVRLGGKDQAIECLKSFLKVLMDDTTKTPEINDEIPF